MFQRTTRGIDKRACLWCFQDLLAHCHSIHACCCISDIMAWHHCGRRSICVDVMQLLVASQLETREGRNGAIIIPWHFSGSSRIAPIRSSAHHARSPMHCCGTTVTFATQSLMRKAYGRRAATLSSRRWHGIRGSTPLRSCTDHGTPLSFGTTILWGHAISSLCQRPLAMISGSWGSVDYCTMAAEGERNTEG